MPADDAPQVPLKFSPETVNSYQNQALTQLRKAIPKTPDSSDAPLGDSKDFLARLSPRRDWPANKAGAVSSDSGAGGAGVRLGAAANPAENGEPSYNVFGVKATAS